MGCTLCARLFSMDRLLILTLVAALLGETLATNQETQNAHNPPVELIDDIRSLLQGISLAFDAENRMARFETKIQEDLVDIKTKIQETSQAGQLLKAQFDTTVALLGKVSDNRQDACNQKIEKATEKLSTNLERMEARLVELETSVTEASGTAASNSVAIADLQNVPSRIETLESNGQALKLSFNELKSLVGSNKAMKEQEECPKPYERVGTKCLFLDHTKHLTWERSRVFCKSVAEAAGGRGDIAGNVEHDALAKFMMMFPTDFYWYGATDERREGEWRWLTGEKLGPGFTWYEGQPDSLTDQNYMCIRNKDSKPFYYDCLNDVSSPPVCQYFPK